MSERGVLIAEGLTKRYGSVVALDSVNCEFRPGEIHAVVGENGAGKSSLVGVLSGFVRPDRGRATLDGQPLPFGQPQAIRRRGLGIVHQHFMLVPEFSVAENLALANLDRLWGRLRPSDIAPAEQAAAAIGWKLEKASRTSSLALGAQQRLELVKALAGNTRVLVLDEPTAVLTAAEVGELFDVLRKLKSQGRTVVFIAHKLQEIFAVADRITVLRRGRVVLQTLAEDASPQTLAEAMVGELPAALQTAGPKAAAKPIVIAEDVSVSGPGGRTSVNGVSFTISEGEVLGFGGVEANGQVELAEALAGVLPIRAGRLSAPNARSIAYIPPDRHADGLVLEMTVADNLLLGRFKDKRFGRLLIAPSRVASWARSLIERFRIKVGRSTDQVGSLSGGNQQKVVVARCLDVAPKLLVAVGPTRGLDVRAAASVREAIREAAEAGSAVALFSPDLDELAELSSRTVFMSEGRLLEGRDALELMGGA